MPSSYRWLHSVHFVKWQKTMPAIELGLRQLHVDFEIVGVVNMRCHGELVRSLGHRI